MFSYILRKYKSGSLVRPQKLQRPQRPKSMAIGVVEFSREGYKIRKVFAKESTYSKEIFEF